MQVGHPSAFETGAATDTKVSNANTQTISFFTVQNPFQRRLDRDNVGSRARLLDDRCNAPILLNALVL